ncbi:hypothetical protein VPH35_118935 [Triticum aestivum]
MATAATSRPNGPVLSTRNCPSASPTPVKLAGGDATHSTGKSVSGSSPSSTRSRQSCTCSSTKTNRPGSFRCSIHKARKQAAPAGSSKPASPKPASPSSIRGLGSKRMNGRQCARRALAPSACGRLIPRTSRLSAMSTAGERPSDKPYFISLIVEVLIWLWNLARGN